MLSLFPSSDDDYTFRAELDALTVELADIQAEINAEGDALRTLFREQRVIACIAKETRTWDDFFAHESEIAQRMARRSSLVQEHSLACNEFSAYMEVSSDFDSKLIFTVH